ncbi:hypothetical protein [Enterobacter hormaechei]|uniref:hypothetical protein n=1 Tax=Enterobacter hormaechei TaxID=158836 RepID=UPI000791D7F0|nr:hypothetical protein [Enterobacter hormaechei]MBJ6374769.1 hypothetical protein [Enterobacter hormaechei]MBW7668562.1 hypothetical protein [Enterobacter hormaechei]MCC9330272.1 hypothetical protein [Enterobacter hormaechei subsp. steigerwaltii]MCC9333585.1 hypothetical protein [Enterobacter hormaechei subsp. steigerwaltii]MCC9343169.1 hypothetical protein [Enterobacter hormaechei subsp. steigerwaltii]
MAKNITIIIYSLSFILFCFIFFRKRLYRLDHKSLLEQPLFWISIAIPFTLCLLLGTLVWIEKLHSFSLTSHGYQRFIEISKLPLLVLAAAVPLASIVNNLHRTIQTEKQITESEIKNRTDVYYAHVKFQTDYFKSLPETVLTEKVKEIHTSTKVEHTKNIKITYPLSLYQKLYPHSSPTHGVTYEADREQTKKILQTWIKINRILTDIEKGKNAIHHAKLDGMENLLTSWYLAEIGIIQLCNHIDVTFPTYPVSFQFEYFDSVLTTTIATFDEMYKILEALEKICIGIVDAAGQLTMVETQVFAKSTKLFSAGRAPTGLDTIMSNRRTSQPIEPMVPLLILNGKKFEGRFND